MELTLRFENFPDDLDATVDFYTRVLRSRSRRMSATIRARMSH